MTEAFIPKRKQDTKTFILGKKQKETSKTPEKTRNALIAKLSKD